MDVLLLRMESSTSVAQFEHSSLIVTDWRHHPSAIQQGAFPCLTPSTILDAALDGMIANSNGVFHKAAGLATPAVTSRDELVVLWMMYRRVGRYESSCPISLPMSFRRTIAAGWSSCRT